VRRPAARWSSWGGSVGGQPAPELVGGHGPDQELVIRLRNKGLTAHTFTQYDTGTDVVLARGERRTVTIRPPDQATSWRFVCRFHDAGGMHGGLTFGPLRLVPSTPRPSAHPPPSTSPRPMTARKDIACACC
jgi:hypothetical protein